MISEIPMKMDNTAASEITYFIIDEKQYMTKAVGYVQNSQDS